MTLALGDDSLEDSILKACHVVMLVHQLFGLRSSFMPIVATCVVIVDVVIIKIPNAHYTFEIVSR